MVDSLPFCVLRSGGDFDVDDVKILTAAVRRECGTHLFCLTDMELGKIPSCSSVPLKYGWPGWWSKMELFRPDIYGDIFYLDLDTVLLGDCIELMGTGRSTMLDDFYSPQLPASGLMYIAQDDKAAVWEAWIKNPDLHIRQHRGDQDFLRHIDFGKKSYRWQKDFPHWVISFKAHMRPRTPGNVHLKEPPSSAKVVCFHGKPRPRHVNEPWLQKARMIDYAIT